MPKTRATSDDVQHRTNVTKTELTDSPQDQGSKRWAERRGQDVDERSQQPAVEPETAPPTQ